MEKVALIFRNSYDAKYILSNIQGTLEQYEILVLIESGAPAKKKKLKRLLRKRPLYALPVTLLDLAALWLYDKRMMAAIEKKLGPCQYPLPYKYEYVEDVNDDACIEFIQSFRPGLIVIYGTGILTATTMAAMKCSIFNIHSSVLPFYRNVHSDFWAYMNSDFDKIGVTLIQLDTKIDAGAIAMQAVAGIPANSLLPAYKIENLKNIGLLLPEFINRYFCNTLVLQPQGPHYTVAQTPTFCDIRQYYKREKKKE